MVTHVLSVILHHTIASSSSMTAAIVCRNYTLECDVPAWMSYAATLRLTLATVAAENHWEEHFVYRQVRKSIEKKPKIRAVGRTRRKVGPWPTWARTWTATSLGPPPPPPSTRSPRSCPPSNFPLWTQSSLLEGEQEVHRRMRNLFWGCRWAIVLVQQSKDNPMYQNCWTFSIPRSRMEQEVAQLHKVGWLRKPMIGCRVWPRSSGLSGSWPA